MQQRYDKSLIRTVFCEKYRGYTIFANINRFGSLFVYASKIDEEDTLSDWYGDNILAARAWVDSKADYILEKAS